MLSPDLIRYTTEPLPPFELVRVPKVPTATPCPAELRERILIDTVHDGPVLPEQFLRRQDGSRVPDEAFLGAYLSERDWGANMVAENLAMALGIEGYHRVNLARVLMDYGRFPGLTRQTGDHLGRFALNYPFSELLSWEQKRVVLEDYYDRISAGYDHAVRGKLIKIAVHTYDRCNASGTVRPHISLVTLSNAYSANSRLPFGVFDALFPDILGEFTCNRMLRDRLSLTMEKAGFPVAHNYPYLLPEGSIEVRAQVWYFFDYLRRRFEAINPASSYSPAFCMVWDMLMDTNLRNSESEMLRSYIHMFRRAPKGQEETFREARDAYQAIADFTAHSHIVEEYRHSDERPSCVGIEVRKDLVWDFDKDGRPVAPKPEVAARVGQALARAVYTHLTEDRDDEVKLTLGEDDLRQPWYRDVDR